MKKLLNRFKEWLTGGLRWKINAQEERLTQQMRLMHEEVLEVHKTLRGSHRVMLAIQVENNTFRANAEDFGREWNDLLKTLGVPAPCTTRKLIEILRDNRVSVAAAMENARQKLHEEKP